MFTFERKEGRTEGGADGGRVEEWDGRREKVDGPRTRTAVCKQTLVDITQPAPVKTEQSRCNKRPAKADIPLFTARVETKPVTVGNAQP